MFKSPQGDGNIDDRADDVNYTDCRRRRPLVLPTARTTKDAADGTFRVVLKHQPDVKSDVSGSDIGESDLAVEFDITTE